MSQASSLPRNNPYVGPRPFQKGETLYGRENEVLNLYDLLVAERIVMLFSPSGAGKTSLLQAALRPTLERKRFQVLPLVRVNRTLPLDVSLPDAVNPHLLSVLLDLEEERPEAKRLPLPRLAELSLIDYLTQAYQSKEKPQRSAIFFDQFEEILTIDPTHQDAKQAFFTEVGQLLRQRWVWAVFALREDYIAGLEPYLRYLPTQLTTTFRLELLNKNSAIQAIQGPANEKRVTFTAEAADKLADNLSVVRVQQRDGTIEEKEGLYVEPVQLQVVCRRLWDEKFPPDRPLPEQNAIVADDVESVGDVDSVLGDYYAERVGAIAAQTGVSERAIRDWCGDILITETGVRNQVLSGSEQGLADAVVQWLVDAYLVRAEARRNATWYELAHDRLIQPIQENNAVWEAANLSTLQRQAALWVQQNRSDGLLLRGEALAEAEQWKKDYAGQLTEDEDDYLKRCREARTMAEREERDALHIRNLAVVAIILLQQATQERRRAERQSRLARAAELTLLAQSVNDPSGSLGLMLAREAVLTIWLTDNEIVTFPFVTPQIDAALRQAVTRAKRRSWRTTMPWRASHRARVNAVAFNSDGTQIVSGSDDLTVRVWDVATGEEIGQLSGHKWRVNTVAFSPDGTQIVSGSADQTLRVWDVATGEEIGQLRGHTREVLSVAFNSDGTQIVSGSADQMVRVWDVATGEEVGQLSGHTADVNTVGFSPDGTQIVSGSDDLTVRVWDIATRKEVERLSGHTARVNAVAFSPDGTQIISGSADKTVRVWDGATGEEIRQLSGHDANVLSVAFSPDGTQIVSGSDDQTVRVWDGVTGEEVRQLTGHTQEILSMAFSPDGTRIVSGSWDGAVRVWNGATGEEVGLMNGHRSSVLSVAFSPDGTQIVSGSDDQTVRVWDGATGEEIRQLSGHDASVLSVAFSLDGTRIVSGSYDQTVRVWDVATGEEVGQMSGHMDNVSSVAFSPDGTQVVSGSDDQTIRMWDRATGEEIRQLSGHDARVLSVAFSPDGTRIVSGSDDQTVRVWDVATGEEVGQMNDHRSSVLSVAFSPDGTQIVSGSDDQTVRVWDVATGEEVGQMNGHRSSVLSVAFSPDGSQIVSGSWDGTVRVWDVATREEVGQMSGHTAGVNTVAFSPDGTQIVSGSYDQTVRVWDVATGEEVGQMSGHRSSVLSVAFSPKGAQIISGSADQTIRVWDVATGNEIRQLSGHTDVVSSVAFSPDGAQIVSGSWDRTVRLWLTDIAALLKLADALIQRDPAIFVDDERARFGFDGPSRHEQNRGYPTELTQLRLKWLASR